MGNSLHHWFIMFAGFIGVCCLWRTTSIITWSNPNVMAKASIQVDLSIPTSNIITQRFYNMTNQRSIKFHKRKHRGAISRYMLQLYYRRPSADIVRALEPFHVSAAIQQNGGGRILEFQIPTDNSEEDLEAAELIGKAGMILRVKTMDYNNDIIMNEVIESTRKSEIWRIFDVTPAVKMRRSNTLRFLVRGRVRGRPEGEDPILLLSYVKPKKRTRRSVNEDDINDDNSMSTWSDGRRRRRNPCRKRPLYVDFATINYDEWVVAPPGYDAYQCIGKCFFPFGEHLNPTKHAIVQALIHSALQGNDGVAKSVGRVCCVPTKLAPTSLLYLDASGTLTYQYGYEDMVVAECGCR
ncbi:hypothetical protein PV327_009144 [Microctonus hyperodae]|uniref:TGF-beta family profile domain-containing protein n=1 Tax=Microctonus hyperodae TaxID=165561 RepID=A0AA39FTJ9_MICHY|nr:hypothetical protein PV327_009144 [Microctonus hyperodae]